MMHPSEVSAVLVTRGDQDLTAIYDSISQAGIEDIVTWDNSKRENRSCYGRYLGIQEAKCEFIYHQDDDLVAPVAEILDHFDPLVDGFTIMANNRVDEEWQLTAMGTVFHRELASILDTYRNVYPDGFDRICDVPFAYMNAYRRICVGYQDLPWASAPGASMYLEEGHYHVRQEARKNALNLVNDLVKAYG